MHGASLMTSVDWGNLINVAVSAIGLYLLKGKVENKGEDVKISTSSAQQVERLETRVMGLQRDMAVVNEKLNKVLPQDDRGPS